MLQSAPRIVTAGEDHRGRQQFAAFRRLRLFEARTRRRAPSQPIFQVYGDSTAKAAAGVEAMPA